MYRPKIIGLIGRSRVGKDTVAESIMQKCPEYELRRLSEPLKKAINVLYDFDSNQLETNLKEEIDERFNKTPRECIVSLTEYMMGYMGTEFFTKRLYYSAYEYIIIPDVRYEHDIVEIHRRGGIIIKIEKANNKVYHSFEDNIDGMVGDILIKNDGSLEDLQSNLRKQLVFMEVS
jgi:dephospho-CoA kinase